jgi:arylamine N-acetyltransferase
VDAEASAARISTQASGGYCYHLNGAFSELLRSLGYSVTRHLGGVHGPTGASEAEMSNHLVLTVRDLPTDANPEGVWYVDAGLGDALHEPLPLVSGEYDQGPFHLLLAPMPDGVGDWHLTHDPAGSFAGMAWRSAPVEMDAFAERHVWLSTSPDSGFVKVLAAQRRDATGVDILRGLTLKRIGDRPTESTLTTPVELADALADVFGLDIGRAGEQSRSTLWTTLHAAHLEWEAAGRP